MSTVQRAATLVPVYRPSYAAALSGTQPLASSMALLTTPPPAGTVTVIRAAVITPYGAIRWPVDLRNFTHDSNFSLINVQPAAGVAWLDVPLLLRSQQPESSGRNLALFGSPAVKPFAQTEWPNPTQPDRMQRAFAWAGDDCNMNLINSPKPFNQADWPNPIPDQRAGKQASTYTDPLTHYPVIQIPAPPYSPPIIWGRHRDRRHRRMGR